MSDIGNHCFVWSMGHDGFTHSLCPHCGYSRASWEPSEGDEERIAVSKANHKDHCPGTPWCRRRGRR